MRIANCQQTDKPATGVQAERPTPFLLAYCLDDRIDARDRQDGFRRP
jgi:hypothetical protein